jgi:5-formyltetrahydrofolate cyclo-ligase
MIYDEKQRLRQEMRQRIAAMTSEERAQASRLLRGRLLESEAWLGARTIFGFFPMSSEPDWLGDVWPGDKVLALPRIEGETMRFFRVRSRDDLVVGPFGIPQPAVGDEVTGGDLVLVPGVAFTRAGARLGRGKGFYDRWLEGRAVLKMGVCFSAQVVGDVPREGHDVRMDGVLTEVGVFAVE